MSHTINDKIRAKKMLVIDNEGNKLGEMSKIDAINLANEKNLDLVLISPNATVPVAKIIDYGKYLYELNKKAKKSKKNQNSVKVKEIYVKPNIGDHDLNWRADNARRWILEGNRVKFTVQTYGRLTLHQDLVQAIYEKFSSIIEDVAKPESGLKKLNAKNHEVIFVPKK